MIARQECERNEDAGEKSGRRHTRIVSQDCTATLKVTELNWAQLIILLSVHPCTHTGSSFYPISPLKEERQPPASLGNDFTHCVLSSKQVMLQLTQTYLL